MTNGDTGMRLQQIEIKGLFGIFDHKVPLFMDERITILHGSNGFGKTTILKMLHDLFSKRIYLLRRVPFAELSLSFENGRRLVVKQKEQRKSKDPESAESLPYLTFALYGKNGKVAETFEYKGYTGETRRHLHYGFSMIENSIDSLEQVGAGQWFDRSTGDTLVIEDVIERYGADLPTSLRPDMQRLPTQLGCLLEQLDVHFIQTQRLLSFQDGPARHSRRSVRARSVVEQHSNDLVAKIQELLRESGAFSASLDRTFPGRLLQKKLGEQVAEKEIRAEYKEQNEYRNRLMEAGLIEDEEQVPLPKRKKALERMEIRVLWHYLSDVKEKFKVFDDLLKKVELFKRIINSRFLYKELHVDKNNGFVFQTDKAQSLSAASLSSGEQHELVLTYQLLFLVPTNSLLLIDEPEISLHITWQHKFLDDLVEISKLAGLDFIIATHSPSIIHKRTDLEIALKGPTNV